MKVFSVSDLVYAKVASQSYWPAQVTSVCHEIYEITLFGSFYRVNFYKATADQLELDGSEAKSRYETEELMLTKDFAEASLQMDSIRKKVAQQLENEMVQRFLEKNHSKLLKFQVVNRVVLLNPKEEFSDDREGDKSMEDGGREVSGEILDPEEEFAPLVIDDEEDDGAAMVAETSEAAVKVPRSILSSIGNRNRSRLPARHIRFICDIQKDPTTSRKKRKDPNRGTLGVDFYLEFKLLLVALMWLAIRLMKL